MRYLLDTTLIIDHLRDDPAATRRLERMFEDGDEPFVNDVVACEAWFGALVAVDPALRALLSAIEFVQPDADAAQRAGVWRADARGQGWVLSLSDALIAAAANAIDATILTRNVRDFALTPVAVEPY